MVPPLIAFDFDGTLTGDEMVVELAAEAGVRDEVAAISARAMRGEVPYASSLRERVALLEGLEMAGVERAFDRIDLRDGAAETIAAFRNAGTSVAVLSGGFRRGINWVFARAGVEVDLLIANELAVGGGRLTGAVHGPLIEGTKDEALRRCADQLGCDLADVIAVGDGANDIPMLEAAGTAIGFDPKPAVASVCDHEVGSFAAVRSIAGLPR